MLDFEITTYDCFNSNIDEWKFPYNYHYLYILENNSDVYIGETNDIIRRTQEHMSPSDRCYKYDFQRIHVITGRSIEETPAKHYEALLIKLMYADEKFHVINIKDGEKTHYERKNEFELGFDLLWSKLESKGLVKHKEFHMVLNSNCYKYSPYATLNEGQVIALTSIVNAITSKETQPHKKDYLPRPILIEGDAGTGKTVVATSLFYYLKKHPRFKNMKIGLVYSNAATRFEIQEVFKNTQSLYYKDVIGPIDVTKEHYDIIICDEAHRLRKGKNLGTYFRHFRNGNIRLNLDSSNDELDWLLTNSDCLVLFYDKKQIVSASDIPYEDFYNRIKSEFRGVRPVELTSQMRIRAGENYVSYIFDILEQKSPKPMHFDNYDFKIFLSFSEMINALKQKENEMGLCRLCGGYAWKWISKDYPSTPDISIDGIDIWWNKQTGGWLKNNDAKNDMGSIYSLPGLDLNYAAVVIGPDLYYDPADNKIKVNKAHFYDNKVKRSVTEDELKNFIINTYAVFLTRGIFGTYVYVCDDALRSYMGKYIEFQ